IPNVEPTYALFFSRNGTELIQHSNDQLVVWDCSSVAPTKTITLKREGVALQKGAIGPRNRVYFARSEQSPSLTLRREGGEEVTTIRPKSVGGATFSLDEE